MREALDWVHKSLTQTDEAIADRKRLAEIVKMGLAEICRRRG